MASSGVTKLLTKRARKCRSCSVPIAQPSTGRPRTFCSGACRQRAYSRRSTTTAAVYHRKQSDEWSTPRDRFAEWSREFGPFTLDVAATADNAVCEHFYTLQDNGLAQEWTGTVWCNPPYSTVAKWVEKAYWSARNGATVIMLVPARTDTKWWHTWVVKSEIRFIAGRLKFGDATTGAPFPSALLVFRGDRTALMADVQAAST